VDEDARDANGVQQVLSAAQTRLRRPVGQACALGLPVASALLHVEAAAPLSGPRARLEVVFRIGTSFLAAWDCPHAFQALF
jgi:hypothetical protein